MCTVITRDQIPNSIIAEEPFVVYKFGKQNDAGDFISMYQKHRYIPGYQYNVTMTYSDDSNNCVSDEIEFLYLETISLKRHMYVIEGFHSYITIQRLMKGLPRVFCKDVHIAEFIIPEHARYYINECGNIVSSDIIFKQFIE